VGGVALSQDLGFALPQGTEEDLDRLATQLEEDLREHLERMLRAKLEAQITKGSLQSLKTLLNPS
jgi:hypothetical protein